MPCVSESASLWPVSRRALEGDYRDGATRSLSTYIPSHQFHLYLQCISLAGVSPCPPVGLKEMVHPVCLPTFHLFGRAKAVGGCTPPVVQAAGWLAKEPSGLKKNEAHARDYCVSKMFER